MPRVEGDESIFIDDTWPCVLNDLLGIQSYRVISFGKRARESSSLNADLPEFISFVKPDYLILQVGIVDASPRIFSPAAKKILNLLPANLRAAIIKQRSRQRSFITSQDPLAKVVTKPDKFRHNVKLFLSRAACEVKTIIMIPILADFAHMEVKSPGFSKNITLYNEILRSFADEKHIFYHEVKGGLPAQAFCKDGYHLSQKGNFALAKSLTIYFKD